MIGPRWMRLALGLETDAEDTPIVCPTCHGGGQVRRSLLDDPEWRAVQWYLHTPEADTDDLIWRMSQERRRG